MAAAASKHGGTRGCYCYILQCSDGSFYTGWTMDPQRRLKEHNAGRGSRYTRARRPVTLAWLEPERDRSGAMRREHAIKTMTRARKMRLIAEKAEAVEAGNQATGKGKIRRGRS